MATTPARVMRGVWFHGFEESLFIPDVDRVPLYRVIGPASVNPEFDTWLDLNRTEAMRRMGVREGTGTQAYAITFVGRRTLPFRNRDGSPATPIVIVDALLTGRPLGRVITRIDMPGCTGACAEPH